MSQSSSDTSSKPQKNQTQSLLKIGQAANYLGVSIDSVRRWEKSGKIIPIKTPGGTRFYSLNHLKDLIGREKGYNPQSKPLNPPKTGQEIVNSKLRANPTNLTSEYIFSSDEHPYIVVNEVAEPQENQINNSFIDQPKNKSVSKSNPIYTGSLIIVTLFLITSGILAAFYLFSPMLTNEFLNEKPASKFAFLPTMLSPFNSVAKATINTLSPQTGVKIGISQSQEELVNNSELASGQVLAEAVEGSYLQINAVTEINGGLAVNGEGVFTGNLTAPNILYGVVAGTNIAITEGQTPTISATFAETDTLTTVTGRGATTTNPITLSGAVTFGNILNLGSLNADPTTASNGAFYYNSVTNQFRCYQANAWKNCDTDTTGDSFGGITLAGSSGTSQTISDGDTITIAAGNGMSTTAGSTDTVTLNLGPLTSNWDQTGAFDISLNNASSELKILESLGNTFFGLFDIADLSADRTYTFPDETGTVCLTTGNCAGVGGVGDITAVGSMTSGDVFADSTADDDWLGLGASAGRLEFDDQATDEVNILNANVGIGTSTPNNSLEILSTTAPQVRVAYDGANYLTSAVSSAGVVTFDATGASAGFTFSDAVTVTGALAANGGITFDSGADTIGAFTAGGTILMGTNIIENIGNTGTDFIATTGALTLAGVLTANGGVTIADGQTLTANGNTILGSANTDTITINSGTSGAGIAFGDSSFATCTALETVAGVLTCGSDAGVTSVSATGTQNVNEVAYFTADDVIDGDSTYQFIPSTTTGVTLALSNTSLTTGELLDLTATYAPTDGSDNEAIDINLTHTPTTSADTFRGMDLNLTEGANALANTLYGLKLTTSNASNSSAGTHSIYGGYFIAAGKTAGTTTAVGLYSTASGADSNYAAIFESGSVGIGDTTPDFLLDVAGTFGVDGNVTIGDANTDTLTINAGTSGTGITFVDSSFATCTALETVSGVLTCGSDTVSGDSLSTITAATTDSTAIDSNANTVSWNWDFTTAAIDSGLIISESSASTSGTQDQQALLELITLSTSTASPLQVTAGGTDVGDVWFNLTGAADFQIRDSGATIAEFSDTGAITFTPTSGTNFGVTTAGAGAINLTTATGSQTYTSSVVTGTTTTSGFVFDATAINSGTGMYITTDSLTTGKLVDLTSTGNTQTSGSLFNLSSVATSLTGTAITGGGLLANLDWTPGSSSTATGDLFRLHIGPNGTTTGSLFNIVDDTSSLFSISEASLTTSLPASFNAPGDMALAYDVNFTNPTASYIKSAAPLYLQAGEIFNSSDLNLQTFNFGSVVVDSILSTGSGTKYTTYINAGDTTSNANTNYGTYLTSALSGNIGKTGVGYHGTISSTSTTGDTLVVFDATTSVSGIIGGATTRSVYGLRSQIDVGAESTAGTTNAYGVYAKTSADVGVGGTVNAYGLYVANGTYDTGGTSTAYGLMLEPISGADTNYGICFDCDGTFGTQTIATGIVWGNDATTANNIHLYRSANGTTTLELGDGTDLIAASAATFNINLSNTATYTETLCHSGADGATGVIDVGDCNVSGGGADLAELFGSNGDLEPGDVVIMDLDKGAIEYIHPDYGHVSKAYVTKTTNPYQKQSIGVISTNPAGVILSEDVFSSEENPVPVALAGRVPVKVSIENGPIEIGDYLTTSSIPGVAMKATQAGPIIGKALESYNQTSVGKILTFMNISEADPQNFLASLSLDEQGNLIAPVFTSDKITVTSELVLNGSLILNGTTIDLASLDQDNNPNTYSSQDQFTDLSGKIATLEERIAQLEEQLATKQYTTENYQPVTSLDSLNQEASESAILAEISASESADLASDEASSSSDIANLDLTPPDILMSTGSADLANINVSQTISTLDINISGILKSLGQTLLGDTTVAGDFNQDGTLSITGGNSINVVGVSPSSCNQTNCGILYIQNSPLAQAVDFFNGLVTIDNLGNFKAQTISSDEYRAVSGKSVGSGKITAGNKTVDIPSSLVKTNSRILLTSTSGSVQILSVGNKKLNQSFQVLVPTLAISDITFDWFLINETN